MSRVAQISGSDLYGVKGVDLKLHAGRGKVVRVADALVADVGLLHGGWQRMGVETSRLPLRMHLRGA